MIKWLLFPMVLIAGVTTTPGPNTANWETLNDRDIIYENGNVGISTLPDMDIDAELEVSGSISASYVNEVDGLLLRHSMSSGLIKGAELSVNADDDTKFDVSPGMGYIIDSWTEEGEATIIPVNFEGSTAITTTFLATSTVSYILLDEDGNIVQQDSPPEQSQYRTSIILGQLGHSNNVSLAGVVNRPLYATNPVEQARVMLDAMGLINQGNVLTANGSNLNLDISAGKIFGVGVNFRNDLQKPDVVSFSADTNIMFRMRTQTGEGSMSNSLDASNYDVGGTITSIQGSRYGTWRAYRLTNGNIVLQYPQNVYTKRDAAITAIPTESFTVLDSLKENAVLIAFITVRSNTTNLADGVNKITYPNKFGDTSVVAGASVVSDHGSLSGLSDNDHPQYVLDTGDTMTGVLTVSADVSVSGDMNATGSGSKLIMRSPDGTCSECGPDNSDNFVCVSTVCP